MKMIRPIEVVARTRTLFEQPGMWCQGARAGFYRAGELVPVTFGDPRARCWSLYGGVREVVRRYMETQGHKGEQVDSRELSRLRLAALALIASSVEDADPLDPKYTLGEWNEESGRAQADVIDALDATLAAYERVDGRRDRCDDDEGPVPINQNWANLTVKEARLVNELIEVLTMKCPPDIMDALIELLADMEESMVEARDLTKKLSKKLDNLSTMLDPYKD